jgi:hypothetical protein
METTQRDHEYLLKAEEIRVRLNDDGDPVLIRSGNEEKLGHVTSAFPISNKDHFVSLLDEDGKEIGIIEHAHDLDSESKRIIRSELERAYFLPVIQEIFGVDDHLNLFTFRVRTDRGARVFEVRNPRANVRSIGRGRYIIVDVDGNRYDIPALRNLDPKSQSMLTEFV